MAQRSSPRPNGGKGVHVPTKVSSPYATRTAGEIMENPLEWSHDRIIDEWIKAKCELKGKCAFKALYASYKAFTEESGYPTLTKRKFALKLPFPAIRVTDHIAARRNVMLRENNTVVEKQQSTNPTVSTRAGA